MASTMGGKPIRKSNQPRINPKLIPILDSQVYIPRETNLDDRVLRNVRMDAPSFDYSLDPIKFLDWVTLIEYYFECYQLEDDRHVGLAKMELQGQAQNYWRK